MNYHNVLVWANYQRLTVISIEVSTDLYAAYEKAMFHYQHMFKNSHNAIFNLSNYRCILVIVFYIVVILHYCVTIL